MTTTKTTEGETDAVRFDDVDALQRGHEQLLRSPARTRVDETELRTFVAKCAATGAVIEEFSERMQAQSIYDYWSNKLLRAGYEQPDDELAAFDPRALPKLAAQVECPYVGPRSFTQRDAPNFFGRAQHIEAVIERLAARRVVVVRGASGVGKTSLVSAGVIPALREREGVPFARVLAPIRPGTALTGAIDEATNAGGPTLLTLVSFEDRFTVVDKSARASFDASLGAFLDADERNRLLLSIDDAFVDKLGLLACLSACKDDDELDEYPLPALGIDALEQAITGPADAVGLVLKPGVVPRLLQHLRGLPAANSLLQVTMVALWHGLDDNRVTLDRVRALGEPSVELDAAANEACADVLEQTGASRDDVKHVLLAMIEFDGWLDGHRKPASVNVLRQLVADGGALVDALVEHRLLARDRQVVEIAHEGLLRHWQQLQGWVKAERTTLRDQRDVLREAAHFWDRQGRPSWLLYSAGELDNTREFIARSDEVERDFLTASEKQVRRRRQTRWVTAIVAILGLSISTAVSAGVAHYQTKRAKEAEDSAKEAENRTQRAKEEKDRAEEEKDRAEILLEHLKYEIERKNAPFKAENEQLAEAQDEKFEQDLEATLSGQSVKRLDIYYLGTGEHSEAVQTTIVDEQVLGVAEELEPDGKLIRFDDALAKTQLIYHCDEDEATATKLREAFVRLGKAQVASPEKSGSCNGQTRGVVELRLAPYTLTWWIQVATDSDPRRAAGTIRAHDKTKWGLADKDVIVLDRTLVKRYWITMIGPFASRQDAERAAKQRERRHFAYGYVIRSIDGFCPERAAQEPIEGARVFECSGL